MRRKILVTLLSLAMVVTMMPTIVFAASETAVAQIGSQEYTSLEAAFSAATDGCTIKLLANEIDLGESSSSSIAAGTTGKKASIAVPSGVNITLDMNGKTIKANGSGDHYLIYVPTDSTLTVTGSGTLDYSASSYDGHLFRYDGTVCIDSKASELIVKIGYTYGQGNGSIRFESGKYNKSRLSSCYDTDNYEVVSEGGYYVIKALNEICTVDGQAYKKISAAVTAAKSSNKPIILTANATCSGVSDDVVFGKSEYTLTSSGTISKGTYNCPVESSSGIKGGTFNDTVSSSSTYSWGSGGISGGTFNGSVSSTGTILGGTFNESVNSTGTISGGTFKKSVVGATITDGTFNVAVTANEVSGGVFANQPSNLKEGYDYAVNKDKDKYAVVTSENVNINHKIINGAYKKYYNVKDYIASNYTALEDNSSSDYVVKSEDLKGGKLYKGIYNFYMSGVFADGYSSAYVKNSNNETAYIIGKSIQTDNYKVIAGSFDMNPEEYVDTTKYNITENEGVFTVELIAGKGVATITRDNVTTEYATVSLAAKAAKDGEEIVLTKNVDGECATFPSSKAVILNLGNYHIDNSEGGNGLLVNGTVTLKGGEDSYIKGMYQSAYIDSRGKLILGDAFNGKVENKFGGSCSYSGNLLVKGGYFKSDITLNDRCVDISYTKSEVESGYYTVEKLTAANAECSITTSDDKVTYYGNMSSNYTVIANAWSAADGNKLTLLKSPSSSIGWMSADPGTGKSLTLDLNGCTLEGSSTYAIYLKSGTLTIMDSKTGGKLSNSGSCAVQANEGTTLNVSGGILTNDSGYCGIRATGTCEVNINDGSIAGLNAYGGTLTLNISGGTFLSDVSIPTGSTGTISGGTLKGVNPRGTCTITGGTIERVNADDEGNVNISGGYVGKLYNCPTNKTTLTGGEFGQDVSGYVDGVNYAVTEVTAGELWKVGPGSGVTTPEIVTYLKGDKTSTYKLTKDEDISDFAYAVSVVGNKTVDLNGHKLTVAHNRIAVDGTLSLINTAEEQGELVESVKEYSGYAREQGETIKVNGTLNVGKNIRVYGNTVAIRTGEGANLTIDGATVEANYNAAVKLSAAVKATIKNSQISSESSSVLNNTTWSYTIRANGKNINLILEDSKVTGVHGAVGVSGDDTVATIKNCILSSHNTTEGKTDAFGALYVATNAIADVYETKMESPRENYSAYVGNNDTTPYYATINLREGCLLKDKAWSQESGEYINLEDGYSYIAASKEDNGNGYNWLVVSTNYKKIKSGEYKTNPIAYVADGYTVEPSGDVEYPYAVVEKKTTKEQQEIVVEQKTETSVAETITNKEERTIAEKALKDAQVSGVAEVLTDSGRDKIVQEAIDSDKNMITQETIAEAKQVDISITVKAEVTASKTSESVSATEKVLEFELDPVAIVTATATDGTQVKSEEIQVDNEYLEKNGIKKILVTLGSEFEPGQVLHIRDDGVVEAFSKGTTPSYENRTFTYEDGVVSLEITQFSEIRMLAAVQYWNVTFEANGGTGTVDPVSVEKGKKLTLPQNGFTAPSGKEFKAWQVGDKQYDAGAEVEITEDTTVKAVWKDVSTSTKSTDTGDHSNMLVYAGVAMLALLGIAVILLKKRTSR